MADAVSGPLAGVRVLDFSRVLAGPLCTMLLGDLGADVIKIEAPEGGDETRQWGPPWFGESGLSAYFISVNRNKRSVALDLKSVQGQATAQAIARQSQIVVENFRVGALAKLGLDYATLAAENPALVYCSITGFGQAGPYHERPGYDYVIQGMAGLMSVTGPAEGDPHKVGVAVSDVFTGLYAANAIQAALRHAERTGQGQHIDVSLMDAQLAALVNVGSNALISGQTPARMGNEHPNIVPYRVFRAADQPFIAAVGNDRQFAALCVLVGRPDWAADERFATNPARVANRALLGELLEACFREQPAAYWVDHLLVAGIPSGPINTVSQALDDPHTQARGLVQRLDTEWGALPLTAFPPQLDLTPATIRRRPPLLGEHTAEVLAELGI